MDNPEDEWSDERRIDAVAIVLNDSRYKQMTETERRENGWPHTPAERKMFLRCHKVEI